MSEVTKIQWTDSTFNPWRGCTKIASGCTNCYADALAKRNPGTLGIWGPNGTRVLASDAMWRDPVKWNKTAMLRCADCGSGNESEVSRWDDPVVAPWDFECNCGCNRYTARRRKVFCASLADIFEDWKGAISDAKGKQWHQCDSCINPDGVCCREAMKPLGNGRYYEHCCCEHFRPMTLDDVRLRLFKLIDATPNLDWQILTKRPGNIRRMWPEKVSPSKNWFFDPAEQKARGLDHAGPHESTLTVHNGPRKNVHLLFSASDQESLESGAGELFKCRDLVPVLGLSLEPLVGPIDLRHWIMPLVSSSERPVDWVIVGGESGPGARTCKVEWIRSIVQQCKATGVSCFVKQLGADIEDGPLQSEKWMALGASKIHGMGGKTYVTLQDKKGGDWSQWPEDLRVRQFPLENSAVKL